MAAAPTMAARAASFPRSSGRAFGTPPTCLFFFSAGRGTAAQAGLEGESINAGPGPFPRSSGRAFGTPPTCLFFFSAWTVVRAAQAGLEGAAKNAGPGPFQRSSGRAFGTPPICPFFFLDQPAIPGRRVPKARCSGPARPEGRGPSALPVRPCRRRPCRAYRSDHCVYQ